MDKTASDSRRRPPQWPTECQHGCGEKGEGKTLREIGEIGGVKVIYTYIYIYTYIKNIRYFGNKNLKNFERQNHRYF